MAQHVEIEYKNLLTKDEFIRLRKHFTITDDQFKEQTNYYFDTNRFALAMTKSSLRVRTVPNRAELTLKQPHPHGLLETNEDISVDAATDFITENIFPLQATQIKQIFTSQGIPLDQLICLGQLTTYRAEFPFATGLIALDHSCYLNKQDFEIEYELTDKINGTDSFHLLLQQLNIPVRQTKSKIERFFEAKRRSN